ncbi:MAG: glutathione S-transferase family protein [Candidatus Binataceae bacterium]
MLTLYQFATSPFCAKVRKILDYKGLAYEIAEVDYLERKELLIASGQLMVPALTLDSGVTIVDSDAIAADLEDQFPEPTIFPPGWRGVHLALARRMVRDRGNGAGFCNQMIRDHQANLARAHQILAPLEDTYGDRAFLFGRIGYADFALYGQLRSLVANGKLALPDAFEGLHAFYGRMDRISAKLDPNA